MVKFSIAALPILLAHTTNPWTLAHPKATKEQYQCEPLSISQRSNPTTCRSKNGSGANCDAILTRREGSVSVQIMEVGNFLDDHAYTIWFQSCSDDPCDREDGSWQLYNMAGFVPGNTTFPLQFILPDMTSFGNGTIPQSCPLTEPTSCGSDIGLEGQCVTYKPNEVCSILFPTNCLNTKTPPRGNFCYDLDLGDRGTGLRNAMSDKIWLGFKDHGEYKPDIYNNTQLTHFNGGCTANSVNFPKHGCPFGHYKCTDIAQALWV